MSAKSILNYTVSEMVASRSRATKGALVMLHELNGEIVELIQVTGVAEIDGELWLVDNEDIEDDIWDDTEDDEPYLFD